MSTFKELTSQNSSESIDEILLHNNTTDEDVRITKEVLLSEVSSSIDTINSNVQDINTKIGNTNVSEVIPSNTELKIVNDDNIPVINEIQATQNNPLPAANSVPAGTILRIMVTDQYRGIQTTHLVDGTDTTSDSNGNSDGFIFNWTRGSVISLVSNGLNNWRY